MAMGAKCVDADPRSGWPRVGYSPEEESGFIVAVEGAVRTFLGLVWPVGRPVQSGRARLQRRVPGRSVATDAGRPLPGVPAGQGSQALRALASSSSEYSEANPGAGAAGNWRSGGRIALK